MPSGGGANAASAINNGYNLPDLTLKSGRGEDVQLTKLVAEKGLVLFLIPQANAVYCTRHARGFMDRYNDFLSCGVQVYCLSPDPPTIQFEWQVKNDLPYPLLSDPDKVLITALGADGGRKVKRSHFIFRQGGGLLNKRIPVKPSESSRLALKFVMAHGMSHTPTEQDIIDVKAALLRYLPLELVETILDEAEYWLVSKSRRDLARVVEASSYPQHRASYCYLLSAKIPERSQLDGSRFRVRKVVFRIRSHDQGWGGDPGYTDPYSGSYTWFEAAIVRGLDGGEELVAKPNEAVSRVQGSTVLPQSPQTTDESDIPSGAVQIPHPSNGKRVWLLQLNRRVDSNEAFHEVVWHHANDANFDDPEERWSVSGSGYGFVRSLEPGDRIAVYVRAMFPGWANHVRSVDIQTFYTS